eukprot:COSAG02_NODE_1255_length_13582_cov_43.693095_10_plen_119_part_00
MDPRARACARTSLAHVVDAPAAAAAGRRARTDRPCKDPMCPSRLRRSTQVVTESTAVLFDTETAGDGAATARGTPRRAGGQCGWGRRVWGGCVGPADYAGRFALGLRDRKRAGSQPIL